MESLRWARAIPADLSVKIPESSGPPRCIVFPIREHVGRAVVGLFRSQIPAILHMPASLLSGDAQDIRGGQGIRKIDSEPFVKNDIEDLDHAVRDSY